jgi:hypothetical protein
MESHSLEERLNNMDLIEIGIVTSLEEDGGFF